VVIACSCSFLPQGNYRIHAHSAPSGNLTVPADTGVPSRTILAQDYLECEEIVPGHSGYRTIREARKLRGIELTDRNSNG
jgi:hypothetical protein